MMIMFTCNGELRLIEIKELRDIYPLIIEYT